MIRHAFKLIWNRKKRNFLLMSEIFFSFIVLVAVAVMAISSAVKYLKPIGFSCDNVWALEIGHRSIETEVSETERRETILQIHQELLSCNEVRKVSWTSFNHPYRPARYGTRLNWEGQEYSVDYFMADDDFADVMDLSLLEGRWFSREDDASAMKPIVVNRRLKEEFFGNDSPVGYVHAEKSKEYVIVGVVDDYRYSGEFEEHRAGFFERHVLADTASELPDIGLISVREGTGVMYEERITKRLSSIAQGWPLKMKTLTDWRTAYIKEYMFTLIIMGTVAGFLVFNVALGLFGVLWYSISRRRGEIGLRRAVGADGRQVSKQILGEALVMATFAVIIGAFIAIQVPILDLVAGIENSVYVFAMACSAGLIYLIVSICALYPSWLAARIQPAAALHDE
jgi:putative ABC transport system permease protein